MGQIRTGDDQGPPFPRGFGNGIPEGLTYFIVRPTHQNNGHQLVSLEGDLKERKLDLEGMVTKTYSIDEAPQAFEDLKNGVNARGVIVFD